MIFLIYASIGVLYGLYTVRGSTMESVVVQAEIELEGNKLLTPEEVSALVRHPVVQWFALLSIAGLWPGCMIWDLFVFIHRRFVR